MAADPNLNGRCPAPPGAIGSSSTSDGDDRVRREVLLHQGLIFEAFGERLTVGETLGEGGQGRVLAVHGADGHPRYALKWYHRLPESARRQQFDLIAYLVERGAPHPRFLWPLGVVDTTDESTFGYLMPIRLDSYVGLAALMRGTAERSYECVLRLGFELAHSFLLLHTAGLCYRDVNFGNVFFDPSSGRALICDNDNVGIDGVSPGSVLGTPRFMAPEILGRRVMPGQTTDRYSLAVLLFYLLMVGHPLEGRRTEEGLLDQAAILRYYSEDPLFTFDPLNDANRPEPHVHDHVERLWNSTPLFVRDLFTQSFTEGLVDPVDGRITDGAWCEAMIRLRDGLWRCPSCANVASADSTEKLPPCSHCHTALEEPLRLVLARHTLLVGPDTMVTSHHVNLDYDVETAIGAANAHPRDPRRLGLRNDSVMTWTAHIPRQGSVAIPPGRSVALLPDVTIDFGSRTGRVVALSSAESPTSGPLPVDAANQ